MADSLAYILFSALQDALQRSLKMTGDSYRSRQNFFFAILLIAEVFLVFKCFFQDILNL